MGDIKIRTKAVLIAAILVGALSAMLSFSVVVFMSQALTETIHCEDLD